MSDTPTPYAVALLTERQMHPDRKLAIDAELVREGWYVTDDGELAKVKAKPVKEKADAEPAPENTAEKRPARPVKKTAE